jgi:hypothetical protein
MERYKNDDDYINTLEGKERYNILLSQADKEKLNNWKKEQEIPASTCCKDWQREWI